MEKETKFIVVPKGSSFTITSLGEYLNAFYATDGAEVHFMSGGVPMDGFYIPHEVKTKIKNQFEDDWQERFGFYSQKGNGPIRIDTIPDRKKTDKEVNAAKKKKAIADLKKMKAKKK